MVQLLVSESSFLTWLVGAAGSPSQINAALFAVAVPKCRSRQLWLTFSSPPTNHLAKGSCHSSTFVQGLNHTNSSLARCPQNPSGSFIDCSYNSRCCAKDLIWACCANSLFGGKMRSSWRTDSVVVGFFVAAIRSVVCEPQFIDGRGCVNVGSDGHMLE
jgi:hypothetical protein